jgi:hypothetical protein
VVIFVCRDGQKIPQQLGCWRLAVRDWRSTTFVIPSAASELHFSDDTDADRTTSER